MDEVTSVNNYESLQAILTTSKYTSCYCEENVYSFLGALPPSLQATSYAVFISNSSQSNLLFHQKSSTKVDEHNWVLWDYHVVSIVDLRSSEKGKGKLVIVDRDSSLGDVTQFEEYLTGTFKMRLFEEFSEVLPAPWRRQNSRFRIVPTNKFLRNFASDRSHMLLYEASSFGDLPSSEIPPSFYVRPPPLYPSIQGSSAQVRGESNNLFDSFVDMRIDKERIEEGNKIETGEFGKVLESIQELYSFLHL